VPEKFRRRPAVRLGDASPAELVKTLEHPNGWHRDTAARLLYERQDKSVVPQLRKLSEDSRSEFGRFHAFYALAGLGELNGTDVNHGLIDSSPAVRKHAVRLAEHFPALPEMARMEDADIQVRYQLAFL